uniref:Uncharacterized protein n=1 Tax=Lotus japonicus TaxID=34305 RepID=I3RZT8_LOTJA|nr:unknown [Lotus japonicus]
MSDAPSCLAILLRAGSKAKLLSSKLEGTTASLLLRGFCTKHSMGQKIRQKEKTNYAA